MANNISFEMVGKLSIGKESEKFKPFTTETSAKGWITEKLSFNCLSGTNRHFLSLKAGHHDKNAKIYSYTKKTVDENGNQVKGQKLEIKWEDRLKQDVIDKVAEFKKSVIDLEKPNRRYKLTKLVEKVSDEEITPEQLAEVGIVLEEELDTNGLKKLLEEELKKSQAKRKEYVSESDYIGFLYKLLMSGKIKDQIFTIKGNIEYSEYNGKIYKSIVPSRIYLADKDAKQYATADYTVFINKDSLDALSLEDTGKYYLNAFIRTYDNNRGKDIPIPTQLVLNNIKAEDNEKESKIINFMVNKFFTIEDDSWKEIGLKVSLLNGAQRMEITEDMLSDIQKEMLELEMITLDEIAKEMGQVYGQKVEETAILELMKGYSKTGFKDTVFVDEDFKIQDVELEETEDIVVEDTESDDEVPFDDVDDIDLD